MVDRDLWPDSGVRGDFRVSHWDEHGAASLIASGSDRRAALEAGLRAVLTLVVPEPSASDDVRAVPVRGSGADLSALFADIAADLISQIEAFGAGLTDVTVDGVVRGDAGHYVAWGYAFGPLDGDARHATSVLVDVVEVSVVREEPGAPIALRAKLRRVTG